MKESENKRTAADAGWRLSRYNLSIPNPDGEGANTYRKKSDF